MYSLHEILIFEACTSSKLLNCLYWTLSTDPGNQYRHGLRDRLVDEEEEEYSVLGDVLGGLTNSSTFMQLALHSAWFEVLRSTNWYRSFGSGCLTLILVGQRRPGRKVRHSETPLLEFKWLQMSWVLRNGNNVVLDLHHSCIIWQFFGTIICRSIYIALWKEKRLFERLVSRRQIPSVLSLFEELIFRIDWATEPQYLFNESFMYVSGKATVGIVMHAPLLVIQEALSCPITAKLEVRPDLWDHWAVAPLPCQLTAQWEIPSAAEAGNFLRHCIYLCIHWCMAPNGMKLRGLISFCVGPPRFNTFPSLVNQTIPSHKTAKTALPFLSVVTWERERLLNLLSLNFPMWLRLCARLL